MKPRKRYPPAALMDLKPVIMDSVYTRPRSQIILSSDRVVQATFGPKAFTPRVPNASIRCWMWSGKKQSVPIVLNDPSLPLSSRWYWLRYGGASAPKMSVNRSTPQFPFHQHVESRTSTCCWSTRSFTHLISHSETRDSNIWRLGQIRVHFDFFGPGVRLIPACIVICSMTNLILCVRQLIELHLEFCLSHEVLMENCCPLGVLQRLLQASNFSLNLSCVWSNTCVLILGGKCGYQIDAKISKIISNQLGVNLRGARPGGLDRGGGSTGWLDTYQRVLH